MHCLFKVVSTLAKSDSGQMLSRNIEPTLFEPWKVNPCKLSENKTLE